MSLYITHSPSALQLALRRLLRLDLHEAGVSRRLLELGLTYDATANDGTRKPLKSLMAATIRPNVLIVGFPRVESVR